MVSKSRMWNGRRVDAGLKDEWLNALNRLPGATLVSICSGHTDNYGQGSGGGAAPHFNIILSKPNERLALRLKHALEDRVTRVEAQGWSLEHGLIKINGKYRDDWDSVKHLFPKLASQRRINSVGINVDSTIPNRRGMQTLINNWWARSIQITHNVLASSYTH